MDSDAPSTYILPYIYGCDPSNRHALGSFNVTLATNLRTAVSISCFTCHSGLSHLHVGDNHVSPESIAILHLHPHSLRQRIERQQRNGKNGAIQKLFVSMLVFRCVHASLHEGLSVRLSKTRKKKAYDTFKVYRTTTERLFQCLMVSQNVI